LSSMSFLFSSRSMGGYPMVAISGKTTRSACSASARPMQAVIISRFPAMSAMVGFIWAIAIFISGLSLECGYRIVPVRFLSIHIFA